jgi:hypothetical protein
MDQNNHEHLECNSDYVSNDLEMLLEMQKTLQLRIDPKFCDENESLASISDFLIKNKHALEEELCETLNALGGVNEGIGSAVWKWWKKDHQKAKQMTIKDLSEGDLKELKLEIVDQFHFLMNQMIKVRMSGSDLYNLYLLKNQENFKRQDNGY